MPRRRSIGWGQYRPGDDLRGSLNVSQLRTERTLDAVSHAVTRSLFGRFSQLFRGIPIKAVGCHSAEISVDKNRRSCFA